MNLEQRCPVIQFLDFGDERGKLVVVEGGQSNPFDIQRFFCIYGSDQAVIRGQHVNRRSEFVLINVSGQSKIRITDGKEEDIIELDRPDSVLLCLASTHYDKEEYIWNYDEFLKEMWS